jgi:hypothetical protein
MNLLDPTYQAAFMEELSKLFESMCEAAKCKEEPLTDPMTGEEITDCGDIDPLLYLIKKHLKEVSQVLDDKLGSSSPNLSKRAQEKWLTTLPLPEYPIPADLNVSGMLTQTDLYATLMNNPRPEVALEGFTTYYDTTPALPETPADEADAEPDTTTSAFYTSMDITSVNSGDLINPLLPDNIPLPRLFTFSETDYSSTDLAYVGAEVYISDGTETDDPEDEEDTGVLVTLSAQWQQVDDPVTSFLEANPYNNLYYSLTKNWYYPGHASYPSETAFPATTEVKGGLYLEKFIKIGNEYWNADNLQDWFDRLMDTAVATGDPMAIASLAAYAIQEAHYGLRLCYMYPTGVADQPELWALLNSMFGTSMGVLPDIGKMQGSFLQLEGVNFNKEIEVEIPVSVSTDTDSADSESSTDDTSEEPPLTVTASGIESHQELFHNFSIPLVETTISAGNAITGILSEAASLDEIGTSIDWVTSYLEDGSVPEYEDFSAFETPWTNAPAALDEKMKELRKSLRGEDDWNFIFRQCAFSNEIVQNLWNYCSMMTSTSVPGIDMSFSETKEELRKLFWVLYHDIGTGGDGFSYVPESTSMEVATVTTDTDGGGMPIPIKMALMTIPLLFKGIAEAIDPNIMIAKLIRLAADGDQGKIPKFPSTLMALPFNIIPPPPFGPGIGPPITPIGLAYLALGAFTPMEKQNMRIQQVENPVPNPDGDGEGTDEDCNKDEGEADE